MFRLEHFVRAELYVVFVRTKAAKLGQTWELGKAAARLALGAAECCLGTHARIENPAQAKLERGTLKKLRLTLRLGHPPSLYRILPVKR